MKTNKIDMEYIVPDYVALSSKKRRSAEMRRLVKVLNHMDPGNDIDDETAGGLFLQKLINDIDNGKFQNCDFHIIFSIKTKKAGLDRLLDYGIKPFTRLSFEPNFNVKNNIYINDSIITIEFHDGTTFLSPEYTPDYITCIAPGLDNVITESNLVSLKGLSHQGLPDTGNGFNDIGSTKMIGSIITKGIPYLVTTPFESFETLFGIETFKKFDIPESIWNQIAMDAFKMIIGRMPPTVPANVLPMAESLVNIPYAKSIGKPGTNSRLALSIRSKFIGTIQEFSPDHREWIHRACVVYVDNLIESAREQGSTTSPIKHYNETIESVFEMTIALAEMGMPFLDPSGIRLNYSSDGNLAEMYPEAFEVFKRIGIFTPAYDIIAINKLYSLLETDLV